MRERQRGRQRDKEHQERQILTDRHTEVGIREGDRQMDRQRC